MVKKNPLKKNSKIQKCFFLAKKKLCFPKFCQLRRLVFDQSSPVHPVSELRGGTLSVKYTVEVVVVAGRYLSFLI